VERNHAGEIHKLKEDHGRLAGTGLIRNFQSIEYDDNSGKGNSEHAQGR
jgi:hypothetical protein